MCVFMVFEAGERERQDSSEKIFGETKWDAPPFSPMLSAYIYNSLIHVVYIENENFGVRGLSINQTSL